MDHLCTSISLVISVLPDDRICFCEVVHEIWSLPAVKLSNSAPLFINVFYFCLVRRVASCRSTVHRALEQDVCASIWQDQWALCN